MTLMERTNLGRLRTDVGDFPLPDEAEHAYKAAPKRKTDRTALDMRFTSSRRFAAWERAECKRILQEWMTGADPSPPIWFEVKQ